MMSRRSLKLESLEVRRLLASDLFSSVSESANYTSELVGGDSDLKEGLFGGPRVEVNRDSAQFSPRLHPESAGGRLPGPDVPVRTNTPNLRLNTARIADGLGNPQSHLLVGQQIVLRADWSSFNVQGVSYTVGFYFDGIRVDSNEITAVGGNLTYWWYRYGTYASPGTRTLTIVLDPDNRVAETDESDNSITFQIAPVLPTNLPMKFQAPIGRRANADWAINNYADVNPRSNVAADYRNGPFQYDGHDAIDAGPWGFSGQDQGIPILAAADGIVDAMQDGYFDRETSMGNRPGNFVRIDHGNGFKTLYYHFAKDSITVTVGTRVRAGQILGQMGSSGSSTGTHLHYTPYYRDAPLETGYAPSVYDANPLPYGGDLQPFFLATGISNRLVSTELNEQISENNTYLQGSTGSINFWMQVYNIKAGDVLQWRYIRPNGTLYATNTHVVPESYRFSIWWWNRFTTNFSSTPGNWTITYSINNAVKESKTLTINSTGAAAIRMTNNIVGLVRDGRTTPIDFGTHSSGAPSRVFQIENHGTRTLELTDVKLPLGFSLSGSFPSSIPSGGTASFTVLLDISRVGTRQGAMSFKTNDPDVPVFWFNLAGNVTGMEPSQWFRLNLPGPAKAYYHGDPAILVAPRADIVENLTPVSFSNSVLRVEIDNLSQSSEVLSLARPGWGDANDVESVTGGRRNQPLIIQMKGSADMNSLIRVMRQIQYASESRDVNYTRRYIRFTLTGSAGSIVNSEIAHVIPGDRLERPAKLNSGDGAKATFVKGGKSGGDFSESTSTVQAKVDVSNATLDFAWAQYSLEYEEQLKGRNRALHSFRA
ncbi:MAG: peptidoglycan DD-metalloendopeptidase family protein [Pirellula sp.]|jgi:murein DD-endopeptidase MepM/ murein hydrolase activator NlpD